MPATTITIPETPALPYSLASALLWGVLAGLFYFWLRKELTPKRFLSIWESDGVLSTRLLGATALLIWGMCMYSAGRMGDNGLGQLLGWVAGFFAVGGVAKAAGALKTTTVNAKQVDNLSVGNEPNPPAGQQGE